MKATGKQKGRYRFLQYATKPAVVYLLLTLVVAAPWLLPGYVLTLDLVFTPRISLPVSVDSTYPFIGLLHFLAYIIPSQVIEKSILLGILFLSGYGAHRLIRTFQASSENFSAKGARYFAGVFYMFNPFVYSRFIAGQFEILLGYAFLPFFVEAFWKFCIKPSRRQAMWVALWAVLIAMVSIHMLYPLAFIVLCFAALFAWRNRRSGAWLRGFLVWGGSSLGLAALLSSYWLVPLLAGTSHMAHVIDSFTSSDLSAFATGSRGWGVIGNVLGLQGFWADAKNVFLVPQDVFSWWRIPDVLLWLIVAYGVIVSWRRQRGLAIAFLCLVILGLVLAVGAEGTFFAPLNRWLIAHLPFFAGYREPQKFVVLLVLAYAYFGAAAVGSIGNLLQKSKLKEYAQTFVFALCLVPLFTAPLMLWGLHGQVRTAEYPVEWNAIHDILDADCKGNCKVVFLPWHLYMRYGFAGRIIADPAPKFFGASVIASNDPEVRGAVSYNEQTAAELSIANNILPTARQGGKNMGAMLARYNVRYVLLAKEDDYTSYAFLDSQKDLKVVLDTPSLKLYEVDGASHE